MVGILGIIKKVFRNIDIAVSSMFQPEPHIDRLVLSEGLARVYADFIDGIDGKKRIILSITLENDRAKISIDSEKATELAHFLLKYTELANNPAMMPPPMQKL